MAMLQRRNLVADRACLPARGEEKGTSRSRCLQGIQSSIQSSMLGAGNLAFTAGVATISVPYRPPD